MFKRMSLLVVVGAIAGVALLETRVQAVATWRGTNHVTFSGPVRLPGVTLAGGTYTFERLGSTASTDVVRVLNRNRSVVYLTAITIPTMRPAGLPANRMVSMGEATGGTPPPVLAWYPIGAARGFSFVYE
jgi:hypothetical protein